MGAFPGSWAKFSPCRNCATFINLRSDVPHLHCRFSHIPAEWLNFKLFFGDGNPTKNAQVEKTSELFFFPRINSAAEYCI